MNAPVTAAAPEVAQIEDALDALLRAAIDADHARPARPFKAISFNDIARHFDDTTPAQRRAKEIADHPVGQACRDAIRSLGKRLHEIGGLDLMSETLDRVAERDPATWGRRTSIVDHRWDGIGRTGDSAGWCA